MDAYDLQARLAPALIAAAPATALAAALLSTPTWWPGLTGASLVAGLHLLIVNVVRDLGEGKQQGLFDKWGGTPTTQRLRWATATNLTRHQRIHDDVTQGTGVTLPTQGQEQDDPARADDAYETATEQLRSATRNRDDHPLVKREVTNYGFRRNLYGCKPFGIVIAIICLAGEAALLTLNDRGIVTINTGATIGVAALATVWITGWLTVITPRFVQKSANRYADELLRSATNIKKTG